MAEKETNFEVVGFLDDDPAKRHKTLYGQKVLGNRYNLEAIVKLYQIDSIFLAIPSTSFHEVSEIIRACQRAGVAHSVFPTLKNALLAADPQARSRPLTELVETNDIQLDTDATQTSSSRQANPAHKCWGRTRGWSFVNKFSTLPPQQLIIIDRYEAPLTELVSRLKNRYPTIQIRPVLCGLMSNRQIADIFRDFKPHIVFPYCYS